MKVAFKIFKIILASVIGVFLVFNFWTLFAKNVLNQDMPKIFGLTNAVVASGSMEPEFSKGDYIIIKEQDQYCINDIICFKDGNGYTTHRIVEIKDGKFITKGDANNANDLNSIEQRFVIGKVVSVWEHFGKVVLFMHSFWGMIILFVLGLVLILIDPLIEYIKSKKKSEVKDEKEV